MDALFSDLITLVPPLLLAGVAAGLIAGLLGVGGGIVMVPVLFETFRLKGVDPDICMHLAIGTSLALIVTTGLSSARAHYARGSIDMRVVQSWAIWIITGVIIGGLIADLTRGPVLSAIFATVALFAAVRLFLPATEGQTDQERSLPLPLAHVTPIGVGSLSVMMGIGGGTMTVPILSSLGYTAKRAVGTSSALGLVIALPGAIVFAATGFDAPSLPTGSLGYVHIPAFLIILPVSALAAPMGARLAHAIDGKILKRGFGVFLLISASRMMWTAVTTL